MAPDQVLEAYIGVLIDLIERREQTPGLDAVAESFRMADIARGGRVQLALSASAARAAISDPQLAELARKEQDAEQRIGALNELLTNMLFAPPDQQVPKIIEDLRKEIGDLREERVRTKAEIEKRFPDYANLLNPKPATLEQVRSSLRDGEALVSIYVGGDRTFVWAVPKSGEAAVTAAAMGEADVAQRVAHLRKALDPNATTIDDIPKFDVGAAYALYAALLKPVESAWGTGEERARRAASRAGAAAVRAAADRRGDGGGRTRCRSKATARSHGLRDAWRSRNCLRSIL